PEQKKQNRKQAATRVIVEHAIGGMKFFHCLMHRIRNHLGHFVDYFFSLFRRALELQNLLIYNCLASETTLIIN
ncbi:transposase family protein, partial [Methylocaldum szegediense]|uniref:transposase family protein n=1 Tax=Methylocaldum szegediense TaxID=73780 RepID=UPI00399D6F23